MRSVNSKVYTKDYYFNHCFGFEEFKSSHGTRVDPKIEELLNMVSISRGMRVLDIGCGRGDYVFSCARRGAIVVGVDYSKDGIAIGKEALKKQNKLIQKNITLINDDVKNLKFKENTFDIVIAIDIFEHLYPEELDMVMKHISRILKKGGTLLVTTGYDKILQDYTYKYYIYPVSACLVTVNNLLTKNTYTGLPKDPRNELHKIQHVNEPTYFNLKKIFNKYNFKGKIKSNVGLLKRDNTWKDLIYNIIVLLHPISSFPPLKYIFTSYYVCIMNNCKR